MRVITGSARGKRLETLAGNEVRPTTEQVKESLFSAIQFDLPGCHVLDLFAGSGQLGIEALSRGAAFAVFCDISADARKVIAKNLDSCGFTPDTYRVLKSDAVSFLSMTDERFDFCFLDPPYRAGLYEQLLTALPRVMNEGGVILCEHPSDLLSDTLFPGMVRKKDYRFSKIVVTKFVCEAH